MTTGKTERPILKGPARNEFQFEGLEQSPIDFLQKILQKDPTLKLKPDSLLAAAVITEYNRVKGTTERPPWPENLCGYIENVEARAIQLAERRAASNILVNGIPDTQYDPDECINPSVELNPREYDEITQSLLFKGSQLPGSFAYGNCSSSIEQGSPFEDLYNVDWGTYFSNDVFPELEDLELTEEQQAALSAGLASSVEQALEAQQATLEALLISGESGGLSFADYFKSFTISPILGATQVVTDGISKVTNFVKSIF